MHRRVILPRGARVRVAVGQWRGHVGATLDDALSTTQRIAVAVEVDGHQWQIHPLVYELEPIEEAS